MTKITDNEFDELKKYLYRICGIDVPEEKRYLFETRLQGLLRSLQCTNFNEFSNKLAEDKDETLATMLVERMTTNETAFFRDKHPFDSLGEFVIPQIIAQKIKQDKLMSPKIRIWSAGCSTGQEPYSLAILLTEWIKKNQQLEKENVEIIASDISNNVLDIAKQGKYKDAELAKGMDPQIQQKYFEKVDDHWQVLPEIKKMITFKRINLAHDFSQIIGYCDVILCRNVIIYFSPELKKQIIVGFQRILNNNGILLLGASENLYNVSDGFSSEYYNNTIFFRKKNES